MSTDNIDTRVVELDFDNRQFEKSAKQSISTLDKLKKSLSFDNVSDSIDKISVSFSKMEVVAITVLQNITNRVINLGINLVKSLTVDNIYSGWVKFGQKTTSIATMAAQSLKVAGKELDNYAEKMKVVDKYLGELNWFSDETSYTFTDMVDNIGKFTAAGQDLDKSVKAMMGIANWAALSGQNASTASRAMYQLSQALSKGYVQLIDYKSIQNANMDTQEFRQTVLDTAVALGELTKSGDNYITKAGKKFTKNQFTEQLSDKWFTDKVLLQSLQKYSSAVEQIYEISENTGLTASEVIEQYGDSLDDFGVKAFKAAQEARTFSDTLSSVKDAYSTAWMKTFEYVFGSYDDAKNLWTDLANELYDAVVESNNFRNEVLSVWKDLAGRDDLFAHTGDDDQGAFWNIFDAIIAVKDIIKQAWDDIFPKSVFEETSDKVEEIGSRIKQITTNLQKLSQKIKPSEETLDSIRKIMNGVFSVVKFGLNLIRLSWNALQPVVVIVKNLISYLITFTGKVGTGISNILEKITGFLEKFVVRLWELWDIIYDKLNISFIASKIQNVASTVTSSFKSIWNGFKNYIKPIFDTIKSNVSLAGETIGSLFNGTNNNRQPSRIHNRRRGNLKNANRSSDDENAITNMAFSLREFGERTKEAFKNSSFLDNLSKLFEKIFDFLSSTILPLIKSIGSLVKKIISVVVSVIKSFLGALSNWLDILGTKIELFIQALSISTLIYNILDSIVTVVASVLLLAKSILNLFSRTLNVIALLIKKIAIRLDKIFANTEDAVNEIGSFGSKVKNFFGAIVKVFTSLIKLFGSALSLLGDLFYLVAEMIDRIIPAIKASIEGFKNLNTGFKTFFKVSLVVLAVATSLILIAKLISDTIWSMTGPIKNIGNAAADLMDSFTEGRKLDSAANMIKSIAALLLSFAIACTVFETLDPAVLISTASVLFVFIGGLAAIAIVLNKSARMTSLMTNSLVRLKDGMKKADLVSSNRQSNTTLMQFAKFITSIGTSLILVSIAMKNVSSLSWVDISKSLVAFGSFFVVLGGVMVGIMASTRLLNKNISKNNFGELVKGISKPILALSALIISLSLSLSTIAMMDYGRMWSALAAVTVFVSVVLGMFSLIALFSKQTQVLGNENKIYGQFQGVGLAIFAMSTLISSLTFSLSKITSLATSVGWGKLWVSFGMISIMLIEITALALAITSVSNYMDKMDPSKSLKDLKKILNSMSLLILSIVSAIVVLSNIDTSSAFSAIGEVALLMLALTSTAVIATRYSKDTNPKTLSSFFLGMGAAILSMSIALIILDKYDWQKILSSAGAISLLILSFGTMTSLVSKFGKMSLIITFAASISAAVAAMSAGLMILAKYDWDKLLAAAGALSMLIAVFGSMIALVTNLGGYSSIAVMIAFGVALIEVSTASLIFAEAIQKISNIDLGTIGKSFLMFAGGIIAFAAASLLVTPIIPVMLALGIAITLLGVSLLAISKAMVDITDALAPFCQTISENVQAITESFTIMANSIGDMIANVIINAIKNLSEMSSEIFEAATTLILGLLNTIEETIPKFIQVLKKLVLNICELINDTKDTIVETIVSLIVELLDTLDKYAPEVFSRLFSIINKFLNELKLNVPSIVSSLLDILILIIDTMTSKLDTLVGSITRFIIGLLKTLTKAVGKIMTTIVTTMLNLVGLVIRLVGSSLGTLMGDMIIFLGYLLDVVVQAARGMANVIGQTFLTIFAIIIEAIDKTIRNAGTAIRNSFKIIISDLYELLLNAIEDTLGWIGPVKDWVNGQREGMANWTADARQWMNDIASGKNIQNAAKNAANSINGAMNSFNKDISENTKNGIDAINSAFNDFLENQDTEVTITPVIDDKELDSINDKIDKTFDYSGTTKAANATNSAVSGVTENKTIRNETTYNNNNQYTSNFNISGNYDPNELADIIDQRMQMNAKTGRLTKGLA